MANSVTLWTFHDLYDHLIDFMGASSAAANERLARRAIQAAYRNLAAAHNWTYYYKRGRLKTSAQYSTGTITYTHSTRTATLASGTWPTWAARGVLRVDGNSYEVASRSSSTDIILSISSNPGANIAAGTEYAIYREAYTLPIDFRAGSSFQDVDVLWRLEYAPPTVWVDAHSSKEYSNQPRIYTITRDPDYYQAMCVRLYPPPDQEYTLDYIYVAQPKQLRTLDYSTGTVTVSANSTSVTGTGTTWTSDMLGDVIRFTSGTNTPEGVEGNYPYDEERTIVAVGSATTLTLDSAIGNSYSSKKYRISSPIDVEQGAMYSAMQSGAEYELSRLLSRDDIQLRYELWMQSLRMAMSGEDRVIDTTSTRSYHPLRLRDIAIYE